MESIAKQYIILHAAEQDAKATVKDLRNRRLALENEIKKIMMGSDLKRTIVDRVAMSLEERPHKMRHSGIKMSQLETVLNASGQLSSDAVLSILHNVQTQAGVTGVNQQKTTLKLKII